MHDRNFAVLTDSACDMPYELERASGVDILSFGITVDGVAYTERVDFNFDEYYEMLRNCEGIPSTAHITHLRYLDKFCEYDEAGCERLLYVSINAGGSATHDAAVMAKEKFREKRPDSSMEIYIVDSHTYSMAYGWFVAEAADRLAAGQAMPDVVAWLEDVFSRVEIGLAAYSLRFMKKSGRISAAAAIAGEVLGIRPIVSLNDGVSQVQKKVRGDKDVIPTLCSYVKARTEGFEPYLVGGTDEAKVAELAALCTAEYGLPPVCVFKLGAAVATNTGPDAIAIVYMGQKRAR